MKKINELYNIDKLLREFRAAQNIMRTRDYYNHETQCYEYIIDTLVPGSVGRYQPGYLAIITDTYNDLIDDEANEANIELTEDEIISLISEKEYIYDECDRILNKLGDELNEILNSNGIPGYACFVWIESGDIALMYYIPAEESEEGE